MRKDLTTCGLILFALLLLFALGASNTASAQVATDFYGQATLLPDSGWPDTNPTEIHASAQFYRVGDAANSTRVVVQIEGMEPGRYQPGISTGSCQGDGLFALNPVVVGSDGIGESTTILEGQQVAFGQWYVRYDFCDLLNPGQVCFMCGKVNQIMTIGGPGTGGVPGMPGTGQPATFPTALVLLLLIVGCTLTAIGPIARRSHHRFSKAKRHEP